MSEVKQQNKFGIVSRNNVSKIVGIQFSILSPEEILKGSVAEITSRDTYVNNKPVIGGLFDPRLGPLDPGMICPTDGLDYMQCPGYFGHIKLARPVFYIQYMSTIVKILKCVCIQCSKLLISKEAHRQFMKLSPDERWIQVSQLAMKVKRCGEDTEDGCGCLQPKKIHRKDGFAKLYAEWEKSVEGEETAAEESGDNNVVLKLTPEVVLKIFRRISDEDVEFMGFSPVFSRPDWMICQVLAVPPPAVRPSVKMEGSQRSEDDITHIIVSIIKANNTLQEKIRDGAATNIIDDWHMMLQYYVATQVNNNIPGVDAVAQRSGRPLKSITERLNGKGGRVRGNLMGKRVDFSARSVITPDPNLSIRELGVPLKIAKSITKPVVVNDRNKKFLTKLVRAGPEEYPGAKILERKTGESISLRYADRMNIALENGDIVHRHMMDGDAILFNRQPTLHRMSMMCHIVRVMYQGDTFRMNVGCTKPYNADFDGDEMNMHMPQDDESEIELRNLAAVPYQLVSPANNQPIIGIFQDSLIGSYLFTKEEIKFNPRHAMNIIAAYPKLNEALFKSGDDVSNFEILSQIIPPLSLKYKTKQFDEENDDYATSNKVLEVRAGKYKRGQIDKAVVGSGNMGLIQRVCNDYGNMAAADFIDGLQNVITEFMKTNAYSVGISDLIANKATNNQIAEQITKKKIDVKKIIDEVHLGIFENKTGRSNEAAFEDRISNILNSAVLEAGKIGLKSLNKNNRFVNLVKSGSKGNDFNISQMISCLGQQAIDGKRIPYGFENRTLPHFNKFDDTPLARGFIESSFISGLSPEEMFFHAQSGRIGLIDTAVKSVTWETPVIVVENNEPKYVKIGEWIDGLLDSNLEKIQYFPEKEQELLTFDDNVNVIIPTTDDYGNISWGPITAITRHDPGTEIYKLRTVSGREVKVVESKSLIVWNETTREFKETPTSEIKVGDCLPVTLRLDTPTPTPTPTPTLDSSSENILLADIETVKMYLSKYTNVETIDNLSEKEVNELSFLYSRIGTFTKITKSSISIVVNEEEYKKVNDVVIDPIVLIEKLPVNEYPKVYDVTVPTTLNFGLANGLQVRDTSQTGYIQRRLIKGMEDIKVEYDMTVRNNKRRIVQFRYGDDGIDTIRVENQILPLVSMTIEEIYAHFHMPMDATKDTTSAFTTSYTKETITRIKKQKNDLLAKTKEYINFMIEMRDLIIENVYENKDNKLVHLPVAFTHTINNVQGQQQINQNSMIDITPLEAFEMIEAAYRKLENIYYAPPTELFKVMYYFYLSPKELLMIKRFNKSALTVLLEMIVYTYKKAIVAPGEMVGMVSAQSIGEPTTQMTLNTFHSSGVASKSNVTRGVPRIEELLSLSENPKNPSITIFLKEDDETNPERVQEYIPLVEHTKLAQIVEAVEICFDPDNMNTLIQEDINMMTQYNEFEKLIDECMAESSNEGGGGSDQEKEKSKWIVRIKMDAAAMLDKKITMDDVHFAIKNSYNSEVSCVYSDYNSDNLIFRLRLHESMFGGDKKKTGKVNPLDQSDHIYVLKNFQDNLLNNLVLRGVKGIKKALIRKITDSVRKHEGSYVKRETWVLDTIGTNLMDILALDYIDPKRTFSNDIQEIYRVFGIEAARQAIFNELSEVLEHDNAYINYHHLALLCDRMTISSHMISIFRHGLNNDNTGPIAKASFEETPEMFLKAARHAELDPMRGISANVMCGQEGYYGTGIFQVMANLEEMMKQEDVDYEYNDGTDDIENAFGSDAGKANDKCSISMMSIQSCVDNVKKVNLGKVNDDYDMGF